jgi:cell division protein FtsQ
VKRSSQAIRSWRTGPLIWRPGARGRRLDLRADTQRAPIALGRSVLSSRRLRLGVLAVAVVCVALSGGWLWFRDSSLVSVEKVTITGERGPDAAAIRTALMASARSMTTLDVQTSHLYAAVSAYPVVQALRVTTQFPHGIRIRVIEQLPVAEVVVGGRRIAVAPDGALLHDLPSPPSLPTLDLSVPPGGLRLSDPRAVASLAAARTAPRLLRPRIVTISDPPSRGLVAQLRTGPAVYLGDASQLRAKWAAVVAVLADAGSAGASYIDVTDPGRPAAGVATTPSSSGTSASSSSGVPGG